MFVLSYILFCTICCLSLLVGISNALALQARTKQAQGGDLLPRYIIAEILISISITHRIYQLSSVITCSCHNNVFWAHPMTVSVFDYFLANCL
jgi:hypothetical protein